jgi:hypothetical protein
VVRPPGEARSRTGGTGLAPRNPGVTHGTTSPRTTASSPPGCRKHSPASSTTPTTRSVGSSTHSPSWASSTTRSCSSSPTTARARRVARSASCTR